LRGMPRFVREIQRRFLIVETGTCIELEGGSTVGDLFSAYSGVRPSTRRKFLREIATLQFVTQQKHSAFLLSVHDRTQAVAARVTSLRYGKVIRRRETAHARLVPLGDPDRDNSDMLYQAAHGRGVL
jgi:hypothetical protein